MGKKRSEYSILLVKHQGKSPLARRRHRWIDIKIDLMETGREDVDGIHLAQDRDKWQAVVNTVTNRHVPHN
jgi:hypothetical protein